MAPPPEAIVRTFIGNHPPDSAPLYRHVAGAQENSPKRYVTVAGYLVVLRQGDHAFEERLAVPDGSV